MADNDNRRKLYDNINKEYDLPDYDQFSKDMEDDTKRKRLYDAVAKEYDLPDYNKFSQDMGYGQQEVQTNNQQNVQQSAQISQKPQTQQPLQPQQTATVDSRHAEKSYDEQKAAYDKQYAETYNKLAKEGRVRMGIENHPNVKMVAVTDDLIKKFPILEQSRGYQVPFDMNYGTPIMQNLNDKGDIITPDEAREQYTKILTNQNFDYVPQQETAAVQVGNVIKTSLDPRGGWLDNITKGSLEYVYGKDWRDKKYEIGGKEVSANDMYARTKQELYDDINTEIGNIRHSLLFAKDEQKKETVDQLYEKGYLKEDILPKGTVLHYIMNVGKDEQLEELKQRRTKAQVQKEMVMDKLKKIPQPDHGETMAEFYTRTAQDGSELYASDLRKLDKQINQYDAVIDELEGRNSSSREWGHAVKTSGITQLGAWDFGITDLKDAMLMYPLARKVENGGNITQDDYTSLKLLSQANDADAVEGALMPSSYNIKKGGLVSAPFTLQFMAGGEFAKGATTMADKAIARTVKGAIYKAAGKKVLSAAERLAEKAASNKMVSLVGMLGKDFRQAFFMENTTGAATTGAEILNRRNGTVTETGDGFDWQGETLPMAIYKGEMSQNIELQTEFLGEHFPSSLKFIRGMAHTKVGSAMGLRNMAAWLSKLSRKDLANTIRSYATKGGIDGLWGEYMEEVAGTAENAIFIGDQKLSDLVDAKQQWETFGSVALSCIGMGIFGTAVYTGQRGLNMPRYYQMKHLQNKWDNTGMDLFSGDEWAQMKEKIDNTPNENAGQLLASIVRDQKLTEEQARAAFNYARCMLTLRGMNIGTMKAAQLGLTDDKTIEQDQSYVEGRETSDEDKHDVQIEYEDKTKELAGMLGISEQQLANMSDEELESLTGKDDKLDNVIYDYQNSHAKYQGVIDNADDNIDMAAQQAARQADMVTDKSRGTVRNATIKATKGGEDYGVYIVSGNIATNEDGSINVSESDNMILYYDPQTGKIEHADASRFAAIGEEVNAEEAKNQAIADAKEKAIRKEAGIIDGTVGEGSSFTITDADGNEHTYEVLADNGDGTAMITLDGNVQDAPASLEDLQKLKDAEDAKKLEAAKLEREQHEKERELQREKDNAPVEDNLDYSEVINNDGKIEIADVINENGTSMFPDAQEVFFIQNQGNRAKVMVLDNEGNLKAKMVKKSAVVSLGTMSVDEYKEERQQMLKESGKGSETSSVEEDRGENENLQPIGKGTFGNIYNQFKGKVKEAFNFLISHKSGDLLGVFHRDDVGDIDLVWGNDKMGLAHIIGKHIGKGKDFENIDDAINIIDEVINKGGLIQDTDNRYVISLNGFRVGIRKNFDGTKKNWIVTAIDYNRSKEEKGIATNPTSASHGVEGSELAAPNDSQNKDTLWERGANETSNTDAATASVTTNESQLSSEQSGSASHQSNVEKGIATNPTSTSHGTKESESTAALNDSQGKGTSNESNKQENSEKITLEDGTEVPMKEDGNPDFSQLTAKQTAELYDTQFGEDAEQIISDNVSKSKKALDNAANRKVTGSSFAEQKASKDAKDKAIAEAQEKYDSAKAVADAYNERQLAKEEDTPEGRQNLIDKARRKFNRMKSSVKDNAQAVAQLYNDTVGSLLHRLYDGTGIDVFDDTANTVEEYVSSHIAPYSLSYDGTETSKGVKQETGLSRTDFAKTGFLAKEGKGKTIDKLAHDLWQERPENLQDITDQDVRNAIIDIITSGETAFGLRNYIQDMRIAQAERVLEGQKRLADDLAYAEERKAKEEEQQPTENTDNDMEGNSETSDDTDTAPSDDAAEDNTSEMPFDAPSADDAPFSAKDETEEQTPEERQAFVEKNRVNDIKLVDDVIGKKLRKSLERIAKMMGAKIQWQRTDMKGNGWYNSETNTIYLTLDSSITEGVQFIFGHEMTHEIKMKSPAMYDELKNLVKNMYGEDLYEGMTDDNEQRYRDAGLAGYDRSYYEEETVADAIGEMINDMNLAHSLALKMSHPLLAQVHNVLLKVKTAFFGTEYSDAARNAIRTIEQVYVRTANGTFESSESEETNGEKLSAKKRRALETASLGINPRSLTAISSADGAKILQNIDNLILKYKNSSTQPKTFVGEMADALDVDMKDKSSKYANFECKNGNVVTIRISDHNATSSNLDINGQDNAISIVVTNKSNVGITNDGNAHIVEYYYNAIKLRKAEGKPLADIVSAIKQALYSGEFKDPTGLAERQEVNVPNADERGRFSLKENDVKSVNDKFDSELQQQIDGNLEDGHIYKLGMPSSLLLSTGIPNLPIQLNSKRLNDKATNFGHDFDLNDVKGLVNAIQNPIAIFSYGNKDKAQNLVLEISKNGKNFIVGLSLNPIIGGKYLEINSVRNVFPKDNAEWLNWINQGKSLYLDKERIQTLIDQQRTNLADVDYLDLDSIAKVLDNFRNPKVSEENVANDDEKVSYSLRQKPEPEKKGIGYKVFVLGKDGKLYPPMVANPNGAATPVGVWLDADAAPIAGESKTGRPQVKQGGKGTQGGSGKLAYRPGWHLGVIPYALQFNRKDADGNKTLFPKNFVFAEVEYAADKDYQDEAHAEGVNANGKYQHSLAGLKHLPTDGYYMYRTNPNPETDPWVITGAMKVNRLLTRAEQAELVRKAGREPQKIQDGDTVTDEKVNSINQEIANAPKFSLRVYHGSGADFTEFDFDHMGEGAGDQVFGWGGYVTSSKEIGKSYAELMDNHNIYEVNIPDDNGSNYLDYYAGAKPELKEEIREHIEKGVDPEFKALQIYKEAEKRFHDEEGYDKSFEDEIINDAIEEFDRSKTVGDYYEALCIFSTPKLASEFLSSLGYTGIKYPAGTIMGGAKEGDMNYVIFKPEDMQIAEHEKFSLKEIKPIGVGAFGNIYDQFKGKAKAAIDFLRMLGSGEAIAALHHKDVGDIDLVWGKEGTGHSDGFGLSKLIKYHPEVLDNLQEILDDMHVTSKSKNRVNLESDTHKASVRLTWDGERKSWLLTAFKKETSANDKRTDTVATSLGGDTALSQTEGSAAKVDNFSETSKGSGEKFSLKRDENQKPLFGYFQGSIRDLIEATKTTGSNLIKKAISYASNKLITDLRAHGVNITKDYKHTIDNNSINHAMNRHSSEREKLQGQIPITENDIENIGDVIDNYDSIETERNKRGQDVIIYTKQYNDGTTFYIEEVRTGRKELAMQSIRKRKNRRFTDANSQATQISDLSSVSAANVDNFSETSKGSGEKFSLRLQKAIRETDTEPTDAQKKSGNYKKGHVKFGGYDYTIENPKGSYRSGVDENGKEWKQKMHDTYGYIRGTFGKDGDHLDMFINDKANLDRWNGTVYIVDQVNKDGSFDEHKVMYGYDSLNAAKEAYLSNYEKGWTGLGNISAVEKADFDKWLDRSNRKLKPFADYTSITSKSDTYNVPNNFEEFLEHPVVRFSIRNESERAAAEDAYNYAQENRPDKYSQYAIVNMDRPGAMPEYMEKKKAADNWRRYYNKMEWGNYKLFDLNKPFEDNVKNLVGKFPNTFRKENNDVQSRINKLTADYNNRLTEYLSMSKNIKIKMDDMLRTNPSSVDVANQILQTQDYKDMISKYQELMRTLKQLNELKSGKVADGEKYSLKEVNDKFNNLLDNFTIENADKFVFDLGRPSTQLKAAGVTDKPIRLNGSKLAKKIRKHGFEPIELKNLPLAMENPIAVFNNLGREGNRSVLTELKTANGNFLVSIDLGKGTEADFDIVSSVFGKNGKGVVYWINHNMMKYVDKEKALNYLHLSAPIAEASDNSELLSAANIVRNFENPKENREKYSLKNEDRKQAQLDIILKTNPMLDDYHTGIRKVEDIKTLEESVEEARNEAEKYDYDEWSAYPDITNDMLQDALETGEITIYSSKAIKNGVFVTPSYMQASDYAGGGKVYEKTVPLTDVAWINTDEGQYAKVDGEKYSLKSNVDNQGNPLNDDGTLKLDKIKSVDDLTDRNFTNATRNVQLPPIPQNVDAAIGANGKPIIIKKNIFEKNWNAHKFTPAESRKVLNDALYNTDLIGRSQPTKKPNHWVAIKLNEKSPITVLEVNDNKDNVEVVGWYTLDERNLGRIKRQAERNGGELIMLSPNDKVESLSTPPLNSAANVDNSSESTKNNKEKYSLIGKKGAANLDQAEEVSTRLDNLNVARQMEEAKKDAKAIKMATGWERGADGKWRYETGDVSLWNGLRLVKKGTEERATLGEMLEDGREKDELLAAYPQLKEMPLVFKDMGYREVGHYNNVQNEIVLNSYLLTDDNGVFTENASNVLDHEIQHVIQHIEGFAQGGNEITVKKDIQNRVNYLSQEIRRLKAEGKYDEAKELIKKNKATYNASVSESNDFKNYQSLAGEVEARNVQSRMGMSPEERRKSLAEETEDVARKDQIFLYGDDMRYSLKGVNNQSLFDAIHTLYSKGKTFASKLFNMKYFDVVETPGFMKRLGLSGDKFTVRYGVLSRHFGKDGSHDFTESEWNLLPEALKHPFAIAKLSDKKNAYRIYTSLKTEKGEYVVVGADVKNAGRNVEVNSIATIFGRRNNANLPINEELLYTSKEITPEQMALLSQPNSDQYPSNQELSAANVDNSPESTKNNQEKYSLIGKKGAANLDHEEEVSTRLDNLNVARQMEDAKKDAKAIKMATGWERGADGKWRYEIPDAKLSDMTDIDGKGTMVKRDAEDMLWTSGKLGDKVDAPELFKAYPGLRNVRLETDAITNDMPSRGSFNAKTNTIEIHASELKYLNSVLNHEIQHVIQHIEGFAQGGNEITVKKDIQNRVNYLSQEIRRLKAEGKYDEAKELIKKNKATYNASVSESNDFKNYQSLAGEVEARNVQSRMGMSPEERRKSLAEETEDVARKDQIFLYGDDMRYSLKGVNNQSLFDAIHTLYSKGKTFAENIYKRKFFDVANTPDFMKRLGLTGNKFTIRYGVISRHFGKDNQHDFTEEEWKQIPQALSNPILITEYYQDDQQKRQKGYRLYTPLKLADGSYVVVSAEVKNAGRNLEINAINTIFGRNAISDIHDRIVYQNPKITPEQMALLGENNPRQYPSNQELSAANVDNSSESTKNNEEKFSLKDSKADRIQKLRESKPVVITGNEYKGKYELNRESAQRYLLDKLRGDYVIKDTGEKVSLSKKGAKKVTAHSMSNEAHLKSIAIIPKLIENSIFIDEQPAYKKNAQFDSYRYYVVGLKLGGVDYTARLTIGVKNGKSYYDHYLTKIEKGNLIDLINQSDSQKQSFKPTEGAPNTSDALSGGKDTKLISILQTNKENNEEKYSLRVDRYREELNQWKKDNNLPKDAEKPQLPIREPNESAADFLKRVKEYRQQAALWATAPTYEQHLLTSDTAQGQFNLEMQRKAVLTRMVLQDSMLAIRKAQEAIMKEVGVDKLSFAEDAYTAENRSHGKGKNEFEEYNDEFLQPLRKAYNDLMHRLGKSYDNVKVYMIAKHGLERNAHIAFKKALDEDYEKNEERMDAYNNYKADIDRLNNDADFEAGRIDFATWKQNDVNIRTKYAPSYSKYRFDEDGNTLDYSGLTALFDADDFESAAADLVKDVEDNNEYYTDELWYATNLATRKILTDSYKAGMMTEDVYNFVRGMYSNYIPLRGWGDTNADQVWNYVGGGKGAFNQTLKEAKGRKSLADDPIAYIENMAESGILMNNRNWVKQHLLLLAENHPTSLLNVSKAWYIKTTDAQGNEEWIPASPQITAGMNSKQVETALEAFEKKMEQMAQKGDATQKREHLEISYPQTNGEEREHEVRVMKNGEEYVIYINGDPQLAQAMNNTRARKVREGLENSLSQRVIARTGRYMAAAYTSLSPLFIPSNYMRDLTMTLASTAIREDARYNYLLRRNMLRHWNTFALVLRYQNGTLREKVRNGNASRVEEMFYDFMMNGGETGFVTSVDVEELRKKFRNDLKDMNRMAANPKKVGHIIMESIETLNRAIEDSNRFMIYMTSIEYGRSIDEAVNNAKDVTLNFNRKGTGEHGWQTIRNLYLFINPAIQSLQTLGALAKHHPFKFTAVTTAWMASGVLVPLVNNLLMSMFGGDDDKDKYWQFTKWDRRNNFIMWVPFTHEFVKIPLAQEFRGFYGIGDMIASKLWGGEKAEESWGDYALDLMGQIVDMLPLDPTGYDGNVAVSLMPNPIRPFFELAFNVDFTGKPLFKDSEYNKYDPNFTKAYVGTPEWLVRISRMVNSIGNDYPDVQQNWIDRAVNSRFNLNNPAVVDHVLSSYLGGAYTMGSQTLGVMTKALNGDEIKMADIPLASKFVSNPDDRPVSKKQGDEFWNVKERHDRAANTLSKLKKKAKVDGDYSTLDIFFGSDEYRQYKEDDKVVKKYEEDRKKEKAQETGEEYKAHKTTGEDVYKLHTTPKDDFEDMKMKQLYEKLNSFKIRYEAIDGISREKGDAYYRANKAAIEAVEDVAYDRKTISDIKKGFLYDGKAYYDADGMKDIRELRRRILDILEKANKAVLNRNK